LLAPAGRGVSDVPLPDDVVLGRLLDGALGDGAAGGLALVVGHDAVCTRAWRPAGQGGEPAFLAYSVTKAFIAALALGLQEEGRLALDDPLARYVGAFAERPDVTLRRLLQHTAGLPDYGGLPEYHAAVRAAPGEPWDDEAFAAHTWQRGLLFEPGTGFAYSNPGYLLARRALERAADASLAELVAARIARPLGLSRTRVVETTADLRALAPGRSCWLAPSGEARDVRDAYHPGWVSHGVVASTASELARFLHALLAGRVAGVTRAASLRELTTLVAVPRDAARAPWREPGYGLGLMADAASPFGLLFGHNGGGPGHGASAFSAPGLRPGGVTACALVGVEEGGVAEGLVRAALARAAPIGAGDP
jgi:D-alanyl-D-alanine carboxypeptidase